MLSRVVLYRAGAFFMVALLPTVAFAQASSVAWRTNLDQAKVEAAQTRRLLLVHFTTAKCGPCRQLDQQVFSQPHVGPAIEQNFVPVRIDADDDQALAAMYRIDRVPVELVITPDGQVLANPPIPDKPDTYLAQLQNMARHFQQVAAATAPSGPAPSQADVNPAYAGLPAGPSASAPSVGQPPAAGPQVINNPALQQAQQQAPPQAQTNPYAAAPPNLNVYGQAQNVYSAPAQQASVQPPAGVAVNPTPVAQTPPMPGNAMPRSYRNPEADAVAAIGSAAPAAGAVAAQAAPAAGGNVTGSLAAPMPSAGAPTLAAATPKPQQPELPAGSPPLAFDGYCPVSLKTLNRWAAGNAQFGAVHRGRTYLFAGAEQRDQFLANPDSFSPVFAGLDPVLLIDKQQSVEGSRALGYRYGESFYLFSSEETKQKFAESPHTYAAGVRQAMNRIDSSDSGTVRR
jgi:protein disulfide-isomerase